MTTVKATFAPDSAEAQAAVAERADFLVEESTGDNNWEQAKGPFKSYKRSVIVDETTGNVTQEINFEVDAPFWGLSLIHI